MQLLCGEFFIQSLMLLLIYLISWALFYMNKFLLLLGDHTSYHTCAHELSTIFTSYIVYYCYKIRDSTGHIHEIKL